MRPAMSRSRFPGRQSLLKVNHYSGLRPTASSAAFPIRRSMAAQDPSIPLRGRPPKRVKLQYLSAAVTRYQQPSSFIMKLFDRSVDLAKFSAGCALYPVCRAWMRNQPRVRRLEASKPVRANRGQLGFIREHQPDIVERYKRGELSGIRNMPRADESETEPFVVQERFPKEDEEVEVNTVEEEGSAACKERLLQAHKQRWTGIRRRWQGHRRYYLRKYQLSYDLLDAIVMKQI